MNLPDPSGSSAPEKPPGIKSTFALESAAANSLTERFRWSAVRLFTTKISASPPAFSTALAVSYSQLVPGNTGIKNFGFSTVLLGAASLLVLYIISGMLSSEVLMLQLYTGSSLPSYRAFSARSLTRPFLLPMDSRDTVLPRSFMSAVKSISLLVSMIKLPYA